MKSFKQYIREMPLYHPKEQGEAIGKVVSPTGKVDFIKLHEVLEQVLGKPIDEEKSDRVYGKIIGEGFSRFVYDAPIPKKNFNEDQLHLLKERGINIKHHEIETVLKVAKNDAHTWQNIDEYKAWKESEGRPERKWLCPILDTSITMIPYAKTPFILQMPKVTILNSQKGREQCAEFFGVFSRGESYPFDWQYFRSAKDGAKTFNLLSLNHLKDYLKYWLKGKDIEMKATELQWKRIHDFFTATAGRRDLTSQNIGMMQTEKGPHLVIIDYGVS